MMTRQQQIDKGKIWQVHFDGKEEVLFEGTKTACMRYLREKGWISDYKRGRVRLGKVIWENLERDERSVSTS